MATSNQPPDYLLGVLSSMEIAVVKASKEHPRLQDKDIEAIYEQFKDFYQKLAKGKEEYEPDSSIIGRQTVIEALLEVLDARAEAGADDHLIQHPDIQPNGFPIPNLEALYAFAFNYLIRSARFWRKKDGPKGYLKFIGEML